MPEARSAADPAPRSFPAALLLPGDAFDTDRFQVLGRRVAGRSMAQGLCSNLQPEEELTLLVSDAGEGQRLSELLNPDLASGARLRIVQGFHRESFRDIGALHVPDPGLARWEVLRSGLPANAFSLTGVIHTLSSDSVFTAMADLATAPLHPWDALVCTSSAGRSVVEVAMEYRYQAMERRFGCALPRSGGPQLPLIPLAVADPWIPLADLRTEDRDGLRKLARQSLNLPEESHVILFLGRLSFHSKAHPLPLYRTVKRLVDRNPKAHIVLLECGHLFNTSVAEAYDGLRRDFPTINLCRLGGLEPATDRQKALALAAADIFVSPADNLQETFGLSVIEAMAAGLPTVVSDWDGYKDLVDHGSTGLRVPIRTAMSQVGQLDALDRSYRLGLIDYDNLIGILSLGAVVDEQDLYSSLQLLIENPHLRQKMGQNARSRWLKLFCWPVVQRQYRELWCHLADLRRSAGELPVLPSSRAPIADMFRDYGSGSFPAQNLICDEGGTDPNFLDRPMVQFFSHIICGGIHDKLVQHLAVTRRLSLDDLRNFGVASSRHAVIMAMLVKLGIARAEA